MFDDLKGWAHAMAVAPGLMLTDQVVQIMRVLAIAAVTWASVEVIGMGKALAVVQVQVGTLNTEVQRLASVMESKSSQTMTRSEHARDVEVLEKRIDDLSSRLDKHSMALANLQRSR